MIVNAVIFPLQLFQVLQKAWHHMHQIAWGRSNWEHFISLHISRSRDSHFCLKTHCSPLAIVIFDLINDFIMDIAYERIWNTTNTQHKNDECSSLTCQLNNWIKNILIWLIVVVVGCFVLIVFVFKIFTKYNFFLLMTTMMEVNLKN